jgi:DNA polymerase-3 subunit delta'
MFRQALMMNYEKKSLVYFEPKVEKLNWKILRLCKQNNIHDILKNFLMPCIMWAMEMLKLF